MLLHAFYSQKEGSLKNPPKWWEKIQPLGWISLLLVCVFMYYTIFW
jgi:hypothetical protein